MTKISWSGDWAPVIHRIPRVPGRPRVSLTIDDGPTSSTEAILTALARTGCHATFFLSGHRVRQRPEIVRRILAEGHEIYGHGMEHVRLDQGPLSRIAEDLDASEALLAPLRPTRSPYLVRLPYAAGRREPAVHRAIRRWRGEAQIAHWSHSTDDHEIAPKCRSQADVERFCGEAVDRLLAAPDLDGGVLLMHDEPFDIPGDYVASVTRTLAPMLLEGLSAAGYEVVPLRPASRTPFARRFVLDK